MSKKATKTKREWETNHARKRFFERYGKNFNKAMRKTFISMIQTGKASLIEKQSNRVSKYSVFYENELYWVIYDSNRKNIVTALINNFKESK